jgi:ATPase family associated with various cellular activities (AAA)
MDQQIHGGFYNSILEWARTPAPRNPPAVFIYGPPGIGKTTLAHRALEDAGLRVVEWNASQHRHKAAVSEALEPLLQSSNITDYFHEKGHRALGIVLDEIDGMSVGDKGGLSELLRLVKEYRGSNAIVCISNEWQEKRYAGFLRYCKALQIKTPTPDDILPLIYNTLGRAVGNTIDQDNAHDEELAIVAKELQETHNGDLRKILQSLRDMAPEFKRGRLTIREMRDILRNGPIERSSLGTNRVRRSETIKTALNNLLTGNMDTLAEIPLNNNDLNLAGLHLHESLPKWLNKNERDTYKGFGIYSELMNPITTSDRLDYYTFFYQHWSLFSVTYQVKLQSVNIKLFEGEDPVIVKGRSGSGEASVVKWSDTDIAYTAVLSKQSWLYNQFRYLCEMREIIHKEHQQYDGGIESTFWIGGIAMLNRQLGADVCVGTGADQTRFERCLKALELPTIPAMPFV